MKTNHHDNLATVFFTANLMFQTFIASPTTCLI